MTAIDGLPASSSSQPAIVAVMLEQLELSKGHRVLEIGAGTGYNAALLSHLVGPEGRVVTVDVDGDMARSNLAAAGVEGVEVVCADGIDGYQMGAPYDRIVVTVGTWDIAPAWWEQLNLGGRLLAPLSLRGVQRCIAFERRDGSLESTSVRNCGFMRMRGDGQGPETIVRTGKVTVMFDSTVDATAVPDLLGLPPQTLELDVPLDSSDVIGGVALWLALHDDGYCSLISTWTDADSPPVPTATVFRSRETVRGVSPARFGGPGLALIGAAPQGYVVYAFGRRADAERLTELIRGWHAAGRPGSNSLVIRAFPAAGPRPNAEEQIEIAKRWTTLLVEWPSAAPAP